MKKINRLTALLLCLALTLTAAFACSAANAAEADLSDTAASAIIIHVKSASAVPYIYYWNTLPANRETAYPGQKMTKDDSQAGSSWYTYSFTGVTKVNFMITDGTKKLSGQLSGELSATTGEYWLRDGKLRNKNPEQPDSYARGHHILRHHHPLL